MLKYAIKRILLMIPTLLAVAVLVFLVLRVVPGDIVEIKGYEIWVNGTKIQQKLIESNSNESLIQETLNQGIHVIRTLGLSDYAQHRWKVPNGSYLAIGDNRDNSFKSTKNHP